MTSKIYTTVDYFSKFIVSTGNWPKCITASHRLKQFNCSKYWMKSSVVYKDEYGYEWLGLCSSCVIKHRITQVDIDSIQPNCNYVNWQTAYSPTAIMTINKTYFFFKVSKYLTVKWYFGTNCSSFFTL